jgi:hypothetical protein
LQISHKLQTVFWCSSGTVPDAAANMLSRQS